MLSNNNLKHYLIIMMMFITNCYQVFARSETFGHAAMTTVLARPLGGYGLTPLIFEPSLTSFMQGSSSNSVPTKVRKSPVYELIMPTFDEELPTTGASEQLSSAKALKKMSYNTLMPQQHQHKQQINKLIPSSSPSSSSSLTPTSGSHYFQSVIDLLKIKDTASSPSSYNSVMAPMGGNNGGGYKGGNNGFGNHQSNGGNGGGFYNPMSQHSSLGNNGGYSGNNGARGPTGPVTAAIQSMRSVEVNEVQDSYENSEPQVIDIPPSAMPIVINFRTSASQIQIHQSHEPGEPREVQETQSEDEPHFLKHSVTKPVIQEVHEIIMPFRRVIQEIRPVEEEVKTIIARQAQGKGGVAGGVTGGLGLGGGLNMMSGIGGHGAAAAGGGSAYAGAAGGNNGADNGDLGNNIRIISGGSGGGYGGSDKNNNGSKGGKKSTTFNGNALQYAIDKLTSSIDTNNGDIGGGGGVGSSAGNKYKS
uniref:Pupal cuticle protein 36-like n=1 Tax=Dermatophagoides pteronyssinus TaxID=6956 RepID=A0A6P6YHE4_DERPT|nr:pupal cuticle protein 36-like [Dermatophagoides pteronyssinus]